MERTPGSNDLLRLPSALNVDPDLGRQRAQDRVRDLRRNGDQQRHLSTPPKTFPRDAAWVLGWEDQLSSALT